LGAADEESKVSQAVCKHLFVYLVHPHASAYQTSVMSN